MGTGYTRNDTPNNIADGNIINAADLDGEFDAIVAAFSTSGHTHDGTATEGGAITVVGPVQDLVVSATEVKPKTTNTLSIGTNVLQFKDLYIDGMAYIDGLGESTLVNLSSKIQFRDTAIYINSSADGKLDIDADGEVEITTALLDVNATDTDISGTLTVGGASTFNADVTFDGETAGYDVVWDRSVNTHEFRDNAKAVWGTSNDLQIYHDGSTSYVYQATSGIPLYIQSVGTTSGSDIRLLTDNSSGAAKVGIAIYGGVTNPYVSLYYGGSSKLTTQSGGIDVTGTITTDGLTVDGDSTFNGDPTITGYTTVEAVLPRFRFSETDTTDLNTELRLNGGVFSIETNNNAFSDPVKRFDVDNSTGDVKLYEDTGITAKITWDASAEDLIFKDNVKAAFGDGSDFTIYHTSSSSYIINDTGNIYIRTNADNQDIIIQTDDGSGGLADYLVADGSSGALNLYHYGSQKLATTSTGVNVTGTITADGLTVDTGATTINGTSTFNADVTFDGTTAGRDVVWDRSQNALEFKDNAILALGSSNDLQIYHDGFNSYINEAGTGNLKISGTTIELLNNTSVTGNITVSGTVDGRDVATDGTKLDTIATSANNYTHPTYAGDDISVDTGPLTGVTVISDLDFNVTTDALGHVTDANGAFSTRNLTLGDFSVTASATDLNRISGYTGSSTELNWLDTLHATGVTSTEFDKLDGVSGAIWHNDNDLLSYSSSNSSNGYQKLPNGLYIQWGYYNNTTTGTHTISFPIAFPNYCFSCVIQLATAYNNPANPNYWSVTNLTRSSFQNLTSSLIPNIYFVAIGI